MATDKILNSGYNDLYNPIFCNLFPTNNGFTTCQNCNFGNQTIWQTNTQNSEQACLNKCANDARCTSYSFDTQKKQNNCTEYLSFPSQINQNVSNINSGYSLQFGFPYNNLTSGQKNNVKTKCANQFLNNTYGQGKKIDLSSCITFKDVQVGGGKGKNPWYNNVASAFGMGSKPKPKVYNTQISTNPQCVFDQFNKNGINVGRVNNNIYNDVTEFTMSKSDPIIDNYGKSYKNYITNQTQVSNINNKLANTDYKNVEYNNQILNETSELSDKYDKSIEEKTDNINSISKSIINTIGTIESFENETNNITYNNILKFIFFIIIISLIWILIYYLSIKQRK